MNNNLINIILDSRMESLIELQDSSLEKIREFLYFVRKMLLIYVIDLFYSK